MAKNIIACACARRIESMFWRTAMQCHCISASQPPLVAVRRTLFAIVILVVYILFRNLVASSRPIFLKMSSPTLTRKDHLVVKEIPSTPDSIVGAPVIKVIQLTDLHSWKVVQHHPDDPRMWPSPA